MNTLIRLLVTTTLLMVCVAQGPPAHANNLDKDNLTYLGGQPKGLSTGFALGQDVGYLGNGRTFQVMDLSDPADAQLRYSLTLPGLVCDIAVAGNYAYVANAHGGLQVVDVNDPDAPFVAAALPGIGGMYLDIQGDDLFFATPVGLVCIDISTPTAPIAVGLQSLADAFQVVAQGDYAYVLAEGGFYVVDVHTPAVPGIATSIAMSFGNEAQQRAIAVDGNTAYVVSHDGLHIIDISDPQTAHEVGFYDSPEAEMDLWAMGVGGGYAYYTVDTMLLVIDVSVATAPTLAGMYIYGRDLYVCAAFEIDGDFAYFSDALHGLSILNVSSPSTALPEVDFHATGGYFEQVAWQDNVAVVTGILSLNIYDMSSPDTPTFLAEFPIYDEPGKLLFEGPYVYLIYDHDLVIVDLTDPGEPVQRGTLTFEPGCFDMALQGDDLLVVFGGIMARVNVADPDMPYVDQWIDLYAWHERILVQGDYFYLAGWNAIQIGIGNNASIGFLTTVTGENDGFVVNRDLLCVGKESGLLSLFDVSDPTTPTLVGTHSVNEELEDLVLQGHWLYALEKIDDGLSRCLAIDVANPSAPVQVADYTDLGMVEEMAVGYDAVIVTEGARGFKVLRNDLMTPNAVPQITRLALRPNWPNPFNPQTTLSYTLVETGYVRLSVYDSRGRLVVNLVDEVQTAGVQKAVWLGRDESGAGVAAGVYFARMETAGQVFTRKMVLVR